jgi:hypothetical protein
MTTFCLTLGTDEDLTAIWILDASNIPIDLSSASDGDSVFLPSRESRDELLQIGSFSAEILVMRDRETLPWNSEYEWPTSEVLTLEISLSGSPCGTLVIERSSDGTRAKTTIQKIQALQLEQATDPGRTGPAQGDPNDLRAAGSFPRVREAFFEAVGKLNAAHIDLSPPSAMTLVALASRGHQRAKVLAKEANLQLELEAATLDGARRAAARGTPR